MLVIISQLSTAVYVPKSSHRLFLNHKIMGNYDSLCFSVFYFGQRACIILYCQRIILVPLKICSYLLKIM